MKKRWRWWVCFIVALVLLPVSGPALAAEEDGNVETVSLAEFSGFRSEIPGPFGPLAPELFSGKGSDDFIGEGGVFHARFDVPVTKVRKSGDLFLHVSCLETEECHYPLVVSVELPGGACRSYIVTFREDERKVIDVMDELRSLGLSVEDSAEENASTLAVHLISGFRFQAKIGHNSISSNPQLDSLMVGEEGDMEELGFEEIPVESSAGGLRADDFCCSYYLRLPIYTEIPGQVRWPSWIVVLSKDHENSYGINSFEHQATMELECYYPTRSILHQKTWLPAKPARCRIVTFGGSLQGSQCMTPEYIETRMENAYSCHLLWKNVCGVIHRNKVGNIVGAADCRFSCGPFKYYRR